MGFSRIAFTLLCFSAANSVAYELLQRLGLYNLVIYSSIIDCKFNKTQNLDVSLLKLYIYDFENDVNYTYYLNNSVTEILNSGTYDTNRSVLMYLHGFNDQVVTSGNSEDVRANLKDVPNSYIFMIDHHNYTSYSSIINILSAFEKSIEYYYDIGRATAEFLVDLVNEVGVDVQNITLMGHSLGGQIIAAAGESYYNITGTFLPILKGFDPAGPCFTRTNKEFQLRSGIANRTEIYHCNAGQLGTDNDFTDAAYYFNGGKFQPECNTPILAEVFLTASAASCAHNDCPNFGTLNGRINNIWAALPCDSSDNYYDGVCGNNETVTAGFYSNVSATGKYFISTTGRT